MKKLNRKYLLLLPIVLQQFLLLFIWYFQYHSFLGEILISAMPLIMGLSIFFDFICILIFFRRKVYSRKLLTIFSGIIALSLTLLSFPIINFYFEYNPHIKQTDNTENILLIMSFNTYYQNTDIQNIADAILKYRPDVITLYELTQKQFDALKPMISDNYPFSLEPSSALNGAFSKYTIQDPKQTSYTEDIGYFHFSVKKDRAAYSIYGIHPPAMLGDSYTTLRYENIDGLAADVSSAGNDYTVVAGDYNMVPWSSGYTNLISKLPDGFYNAGQGRGIYNTWSPFYKFDLPVSTIDQVILSPNLFVTDFKNIWIDGSDHHALIVQISP